MKAEYLENKGCLQRDSVERKEYGGARSIDNREAEEADGAEMLERILDRDNLNKAYKRVKANKGAPGIDGMTVEEALSWLREHRDELLESIRGGKYKPQPVRRKEIPKPDGGVRKLGIPTVVDRIIQQAIAQQLTPIFEPLFSENSFGYRPGKSAQMAIRKVKEYAEQGYKYAVLIDLSKYFDTLNHELLMNMVREQIHDKRVTDQIKKYLKSGVMENGLLVKTEKGSPQGGPLSPLLANIYLNKFDQKMGGRGVPVIRYADDIVVLAKVKGECEYEAVHHGEGLPIYNCPECDVEAFVRTDDQHYACFACGTVFNDDNIAFCNDCGQPYIFEGEEDIGLCPDDIERKMNDDD